MADVLIGVVTESILSKAISLANDQISGVLGVKEDLRSLAETLELIQALLSDAECKSTTNNTVKVWLKQLEDVANAADDLLDEFSYEVQNKKMRQGMKEKVLHFFSSSNPLVFSVKMASEIKKIKLQLNEIFKKADQMGLRAVEISNSSPNDPRKVPLSDPFVDDSRIVGREQDVREIVNRLTCFEDEKNLSVIGIIGMGGQGKTTLAQLLMKNSDVNQHFEKKIWTCVSNDFDVDRILKDMLQSLTGEASQLTVREAIVKRLSEQLQGKRFLLVLDDVWNEDSEFWNCMNSSLQVICGSKGSKIIVTTRSETVITIMDGFFYRLRILSEKDSQELFEKIAFGNGKVRKTPQLVEIGERIVARCGGVPLALKAIGGLMSSQRDELEWLKIEESNIWSSLNGVHSALKLSFDHLPCLSIKQCFTYCSVFPKDSVMKKKDLIQQWMAHGFLNPSKEGNLDMEDVGNNFFKILVQRSFLQEVESAMYDNNLSCRMHDLVHDFALETSKGHCLSAKVGEFDDDIKPVHLSILLDGSNNLNISEKIFSRLRTLHITGELSDRNFLVHCKCKRLRVLTVDAWEIEELPISIEKMKHLRYLDISGTNICTLPKFISKLYNLQTLRLPFTSLQLEKGFGRFVNLRHLGMSKLYPKTNFVSGINQLIYLKTLREFHVSQEKGWRIEELCNLSHLEGSLSIFGLENVMNENEARRANLLGKSNIGSLRFSWEYDGTSCRNHQSVLEGLEPHRYLKALGIYGFSGTCLPSWILMLHNLKNLKLGNLDNCEHVPPLGHLQFLEVLDFSSMKSLKYISNDFYGCPNLDNFNSSQISFVAFPSLKILTFWCMDSLEEWSDTAILSSSCVVKFFPRLEKLTISRCYSLTRIGDGLISACIKLESLYIKECTKLVSIPNLSSLHSLKELDISFCNELQCLPHGINACNLLQNLNIQGPTSLIESLVTHNLPNLRSLTLFLSENIVDNHYYTLNEPISDSIEFISNLEILDLHSMWMPRLVSLPEQIHRLIALRSLSVHEFHLLQTLPEWLGSFHSLESLSLISCESLVNLPSMEVVQGLSNLKSFYVYGCPILKQRLDKETGAEWHKIAHIPSIHIL